MNDIKKQNDALNLLKGVACIAVVSIHVQFPGFFGQAVIALARSGVALFFVISGYYLYRPDDEGRLNKLPMKIVRIAKLSGKALLIYFAWESFVRLAGGGIEKVFQWYSEDLFTVKNLIQLFLFSYDPVVGHLWFLIALLEAYILFMVLTRVKIRVHWLIAFAVLELHIVLMAFSDIFGLGWNMHVFRSVWFYGFPFLMFLDKGKGGISFKMS